MRNINEYKKRFYNLMESTMGDVKPLISEDTQHEEFVTPTIKMLSYGHVESLDTPGVEKGWNKSIKSWNKSIKSKTSLSGNEYKSTLSDGMYKSLERIKVYFGIVGKLKLIEKVLTKSDNVIDTKGLGNSTLEIINDEGLETELAFVFNMPKTQKEFKEKSPYIAYIDVPCENVRGGKLRFSAEVPSDSEIFELPENPLNVNDTEMGGDYE
jgi:hypothetical protein